MIEATGGKGADLVIDCAGGDETFDQSIRMAKPGGKVLLVAFYHGPVTADVSHAVRRNITISLYPDLTIHRIYNGWWFVGRPTLAELRQDLRAIMQKCRTDYEYVDPPKP